LAFVPFLGCHPLVLIAKLVGCARGRDRKRGRWDFSGCFSAFARSGWCQAGATKYRDRNIDFADACLIRLADQFGTADILTLDQDFAIYRWGKNKPFRMLPSKD
jgi:hypothetical protein